MALIEDELSISTIQKIFELNLAIPEYQRPYRWSTASANMLFMDIYEAYEQNLSEYRLGSVILNKKDGKYNIVDGQQRITTLCILLYCLGDKNAKLLNESYSMISTNSIARNFKVLERKVSEIQDSEKDKYKKYLLEKCTIVKIVTDEEQEAFQFFDSQNSRGKELAPHDLLKSYHLREMNNEEESLKIKIISNWEDENQADLEELFKYYLYPITQWYRGKNGLDYSSEKIGTFKGIKINNMYNYGIYHKGSNFFIEKINKDESMRILSAEPLNQFQLTQPLIAGKRFFKYTLYYADLLGKIQQKIAKFHNEDEIPNEGTGNIYIKQLYESILLFFADRFGINAINDTVMKQLYTWSYSLRVVMKAVYIETINKYAIGLHERINYGIDLFNQISEMIDPEELNLINFNKIEEFPTDKYEGITKFLKKGNRW